MNHCGVILRHLRILNHLPIKKAAAKIGRSAGWLSEIENERGNARLHPQEFERIVAVYGGESYRKQFGIWVAKANKPTAPAKEPSFGGAILKHLRKKSKKSLKTAAREVGISGCYLSCIETGSKPLPANLRDKLMHIYGYSPSSFKNFATEDKRAKNIPVRYKLEMLLKQMDDIRIEKVFGFAVHAMETPAIVSQSSP